MDSEGLAPSVRRTGKLSLPFRATSLILVQGPHPSGPLFPHGQLGLYLAACGCEGRYCFITRPSSEQNVVMDPKAPVTRAQSITERNRWKRPQKKLVCSPNEGTESQKEGRLFQDPRATYCRARTQAWAPCGSWCGLTLASLKIIPLRRTKLISKRKQPHLKPPSGNFTQ